MRGISVESVAERENYLSLGGLYISHTLQYVWRNLFFKEQISDSFSKEIDIRPYGAS